MAKRLHKLKIDEVSSVKRGAGDGVKVVLMKRLEKYSPDQPRVPAGGTGGGEWVGSNSRGTQPAPVKDEYFCGKTGSTHGCTFPGKCVFGACPSLKQGGQPNVIQPLTPWRGDAHAQDFPSTSDKLMASLQDRDSHTGPENHPEYAHAYDNMPGLFGKQEREMNEIIAKANAALHESVQSIVADDDLDDKASAITKSFKQYHEFIAATGAAAVAKGEVMSDDVKKQIADLQALVTTLTKIAIEKMSKEEKDHMDGLGSDDEKSKFATMSDDERSKLMAKKSADLPADVKKRLTDADDIKKRLAVVEEREEVASFKKRAVDLGLAEAHGEILRKAHAGDKDAMGEVEKILAGLTAQVKTGKVFAEFGKTGGGGSTANEQLKALGEELRKSDQNLTKEQAFTKVYTDPRHADLVAQSKREHAQAA